MRLMRKDGWDIRSLTHLTAEHGRLCDMPLTPSMLTIKSPKSLCATRNGDYTPHAPPHNSHFTPHTSHLTPHTSHAPRHTSHVTRHTSHLTRHTSHLTRHTSHVTRRASHVTRHTSHLFSKSNEAASIFSSVTRPCSTPQVNRCIYIQADAHQARDLLYERPCCIQRAGVNNQSVN